MPPADYTEAEKEQVHKEQQQHDYEDDEDKHDEYEDLDEDPDLVALRASVPEELRSQVRIGGIDRRTFEVIGSADDVAHARGILAASGMIPLSDLAGHRGAVQMWREHCQSRRTATIEELTEAVRQVLSAPRPLPPSSGTQAPPFYAWIRPSSIPVTDHEDFPYHHTPAGLAGIAHRLIAEAGSPAGLNKILGFNFDLTSTFTPHGPVHHIGANGNHRAAALRAAGFPVALALITPQQAPWTIPSFVSAEPLFRLLYRSGLLTGYRRADGEDQVDCESIAAWFLDVDSPADARTNLLAYEAVFGHLEDPRLSWMRSHRSFRRMLRDETIALREHGPDLLPGVAGQWPPQPTLAQRAEYWLVDRWSKHLGD